MSLFSGPEPTRSTNPFVVGNSDVANGDDQSSAVLDSFQIYVNSLQGSSSNNSLSQSSSRNSLNLLEPTSDVSPKDSGNNDYDDIDNQKDNISQNNWFIDAEDIVVKDQNLAGSQAPNSDEENPAIRDDNDDSYELNEENGVECSDVCKNTLAFDAHSGASLRYFLNLNHQKISSLIESNSTSSLKKSSSASSFATNDTSPTTAMNVASKKRGLFSRASKSATTNASSTSINEQPGEENGKLKSSPGAAPSSPSTTSHHLNELDEDRFNGEGVMFQGKLIGHEYVAEARGEQMCQQSLKKLKIVQKHLGGHKRKVNMYISFDGIKIQDSNTCTELFHHTVPQISFISRDETDTRAFGYVFGNSQTGHQFIGIKTKKEAMVIMSTIGQLFAITLKRKRNAEEAAAAEAAATTSGGYISADEHVYHSVPDSAQPDSLGFQADGMLNLSVSGSSNKSRARIRVSGSSNENVPIPILPPPSADQHLSRHRHQHGGGQHQSNRIPVANDFNNNHPKTASQALINELDLFQPSSAPHLGASMDSSFQKNSKLNATLSAETNRLAQSFDWAHFGDDDNHSGHSQLNSQAHDDSTLNTISSISDTLTGTTGNLTQNESATLVAGSGVGPNDVVIYPNHPAPQHGRHGANAGGAGKLTSSSTTISSANFDGIDPFSDAFGDDPFSTASTTADISSNVLSGRVQSQHQQPYQNRPPSNPTSGTFDSNKLGLKNQEISSGSVPTLADSFGSISLEKANPFKGSAELSRSQESSDKYAVLHDIASISTSIFDSVGGSSENNATIIPNKSEQDGRSRPGSNLSGNLSSNRIESAAGGFAMFPPQSNTPTNVPHQNFSTSMAPTSFSNVSYQVQQSRPQPQIPFGVNGVVVLPPLTNKSQNGGVSQPNVNVGYSTTGFNQPVVSKNQWANKSLDETRAAKSDMIRSSKPLQAPRAEFDSLSNLSSTSSNASSSNIYQSIIPSATAVAKMPATDSKSESASVPLFQDLDPLNKNKAFVPNPFVMGAENANRNRSPLLNAALDSSLASSMNSSNSSLFTNNSRNCSTPSSLHQNRKSSPQLISQLSLPNQTTMATKTVSSTTVSAASIPLSIPIPAVPTTSSPSEANTSSIQSEVSASPESKSFGPIVTTTGTMNPSPHYIMLYNLKTASTSPKSAEDKSELNDPISKSDGQSLESKQTASGQPEEESNISPSSTPAVSTMLDDHNVNKTDDDHGDLKQRSRTSSVSSSNSLLINQSNFSELKFDDVFDTPLLDQDLSSAKSANNSGDIEPEKELQKPASTEELVKSDVQNSESLKTNGCGTKPGTSDSRVSLSRQSSACSTPPAIPPRTDLHFKYQQRENPGPQPPGPVPPPLHYHHRHSPYGHRNPHPPPPPPPPPIQQHYQPPPPYFSSPPQQQQFYTPYIAGIFADPTGSLRRHSSSNQSRYWNAGYDWYGPPPPPPPMENPYGHSRPLDYAPPLPPNIYSDYPMAAYHSRPFYGPPPGPTGSPWHDYYPPPPPHMVHAPPSHHRAGYREVSMEKTETPGPATSTGDKLSTSSSPPPTGVDSAASITPPLPNPQRRTSASSKASSVGAGADLNRFPGQPLLAGTPSSSTLQRTSSLSSSNLPPSRDFNDYPLPQTHQHYGSSDETNAKFVRPGSGGGGGALDQSDHQLAFESPTTSMSASQLSSHHQSQFASFNSNMEQMIMRYHHQPGGSGVHRAMSPYDYGTYGSPSYSSYQARMMPAPLYTSSLGSSSSGYSSANINHHSAPQLPPPPSMMMSAMDHHIASRFSPNPLTPWDSNPNQASKSGDKPPPVDDQWQALDSLPKSENNNCANTFEDDFSNVMVGIQQPPTSGNMDTDHGPYDTVKRGSFKQQNVEKSETESNTGPSLQSDSGQPAEINSTTEKNVQDSSPATNSPDDRNIFVAKDDPFEDDDFFKS